MQNECLARYVYESCKKNNNDGTAVQITLNIVKKLNPGVLVHTLCTEVGPRRRTFRAVYPAYGVGIVFSIKSRIDRGAHKATAGYVRAIVGGRRLRRAKEVNRAMRTATISARVVWDALLPFTQRDSYETRKSPYGSGSGVGGGGRTGGHGLT